MIRLAQAMDVPSIRKIWLRCFPADSGEGVERFLAGCFALERCLLYETNGRPAAMLHLLPIRIRCGGAEYPSQYLYAAATLPEYRARGVMAELLRAARRQGESDGCAFTLLLPASDRLAGYYARNGYRTATVQRNLRLPAQALFGWFADVPSAEPVALDRRRVARQLQDAFSQGVYFCNGIELYAVDDWLAGGGKILPFADGAVFYRTAGKLIFVKEIFGANEEGMLLALLDTLTDTAGSDMRDRRRARAALDATVAFRLPAQGTQLPRGDIIPFGMLQQTGPQFSAAFEAVCAAQVYFNWALE